MANSDLAGGELVGNSVINGSFVWTGGYIGGSAVLTLASNATLAVDGGEMNMDGILTNAGTININSGDLRLIQDGGYGSGPGLLINQSNATVNFTADTFIGYYNDGSGGFGPPTLINNGLVVKSAGTSTSSINAPLNNSGTLNAQTGTIALNASSVDNPGGILTAAGTIYLSGNTTFTFNGLMTNANVTLGGAVLTGNSGVIVASTLTWTGGYFYGGSTLTVAPSGVVNVDGGELDLDGVLTNAGTININSGNLRLIQNGGEGSGPGLLINQSNGTVNFPTDTYINYYNDGSGGFGPPTLINNGLVIKSGGTGTSSINPPLNNSGTLNAQTGAITLNGGLSSTGGTLQVGITSAANYGVINIGGSAPLSGLDLAVNLESGFVPTVSNSFAIVTYGSAPTSFAGTNLPPIAVWQAVQANNNFTITVQSLVPAVVWSTPAPVPYGTVLGPVQLDASSTIAGSFTYNPPAGTIIGSGNQTLTATFTPTDTNDYSTSIVTTTLGVLQAPLTITASNLSKTYGQTLTFAGTEFPITSGTLYGTDAIASVSLNSAGTVSNASVGGSPYTIVVSNAVGSGATNYFITYASGLLTVNKAAPVITWANPARIINPAPLTSNQLDATANVPGSFVYNPPAGTVLSPGGNQTLSTTFTPADTTDYTTTNASVTLNVLACDVTPSGLLSWWKGDSNTFDVIGGNTGTLENGAGYTNGELNEAFALTGDNQMVVVGDATNLWLQNFTIEGWVQRGSATTVSSDSTADAGNALVFSFGHGGYGLGMTSGGAPLLTQVDFGGVAAGASVTDTNWHHIAVTSSGGTVIFYIDGTAYPAGTYNPTYTFTTEAAIGGRADNLNQNNNDSFLGAIDELSVYNRALTAGEIAAIYNIGSGGKCVPLIAITWANPADILYGTALGGAQLNAAANVAGTFVYSPPAGTVLPAGSNLLSVTFMATDTADYPSPVIQTASINVDPVPLTVTASNLSKTSRPDRGLCGHRVRHHQRQPGGKRCHHHRFPGQHRRARDRSGQRLALFNHCVRGQRSRCRQLRHHLCARLIDGQPGVVDHHGQQRGQELRTDADLRRHGVHTRRPAKRRNRWLGHIDQSRFAGHGPGGGGRLRHPGRQCRRWHLLTGELHDSLCARRIDGLARAAHHHGQQRVQELRPDADLCRNGIHHRPAFQRRFRDERDFDQHRGAGHGHGGRP